MTKPKGDTHLHITTQLPDHPTARVVTIFRPLGEVAYPNLTPALRHAAQQPARYLDLLTFCHIQRRVSSLRSEVHPTRKVGDLILKHEYLHVALVVRVYIFALINLVSRHYIFVHGGVQLAIHRRYRFDRLEVASILYLQSIALRFCARQCNIRLFSRRKRNLASVVRGGRLFLFLKLYLGAIRGRIFIRLRDSVLSYLCSSFHPHHYAASEVAAIVVVGIAILIVGEVVTHRGISRIVVRIEENWGAQSISRKDRELIVKVRVEAHPTASDSIFDPQCRHTFRRVFATIRIDVCDRIRPLYRIHCHVFRMLAISSSLFWHLNPKTIIRNVHQSILRVTIFARRHSDRQAGRIHEHLRCVLIAQCFPQAFRILPSASSVLVATIPTRASRRVHTHHISNDEDHPFIGSRHLDTVFPPLRDSLAQSRRNEETLAIFEVVSTQLPPCHHFPVCVSNLRIHLGVVY